jgi:hypothetical protein
MITHHAPRTDRAVIGHDHKILIRRSPEFRQPEFSKFSWSLRKKKEDFMPLPDEALLPLYSDIPMP